eukprot:m.214364 g.214364  ORF g.214364 m.214364 type:complete len:93 (+) comp15866_c0_seq10:281-559(+)
MNPLLQGIEVKVNTAIINDTGKRNVSTVYNCTTSCETVCACPRNLGKQRSTSYKDKRPVLPLNVTSTETVDDIAMFALDTVTLRCRVLPTIR